MINNIKDKQSFIEFVKLLVQNLKENPDEWENNSLELYLEAVSSWVEDMEGYYSNNNLAIPENINWSVFANILMAAKMYE